MMISTTIKAVIKVETDCDFKLGFPKFIKGLYKLKYDQDYLLELRLNEKTAKDDLIEVLKEIEIDSSKEWHQKDLKEGVLDYEKQLKEHGLSGTYSDILGGGNWSFTVEISRVWEEFL